MNAAVVQGSAVTFECSSNNVSSKLPWFNSSCVTTSTIDKCKNDVIYSGLNNDDNTPPPSRFSVTAVNNATHVTRDLNIVSTQLNDAGVYLCAERLPSVSISDSTSSGQLIVLGK